MVRVPQISSRDLLPESERHNFDAIAESRGRVGGPFAVLLNSPDVAGRIAHVGTYLRFETSLAPQQRELAIIATAREWDCALEWGAHVPLARNEGVSEAAIEVVGKREAADGLAAAERLIVQCVRELVRDHRVSHETFETAHGALGDRGVTDLIATVGYYGMLACALNAFEVPPADGAVPLP